MKLLIVSLLAMQLGESNWPGPAELEPDGGSTAWAARPADDFERRLAALEVALSTVIARPIDAWRFNALRREAESLRAATSEPSGRAATEDVLQRIDRFAKLAARTRQTTAAAPPRLRTRFDPSPQPTKLAPSVRLTKAREPNRPDDIRGVLRPVVSQRADAPKFGVVDERGRLAALVTPTPETEERLEALLGRRVAIDGERGFRTDVRQPHVVAERVTALPVRRR